METIRILFIIAIKNDFLAYQFDIKNAFLHSKLEKEIYIKLPSGFEDYILKKEYYNKNPLNNDFVKGLEDSYNKYKNNNNIVCKLNKALYGLKQSPRL